MVCYNPKIGTLTKISKINEKTGEIYNTLHLTLKEDKNPLDSRFWLIPCNKCEGCRLSKSQDWATRAYLQHKLYPVGIFLTLTYNNKHLPKNRTLVKKDLQNFFKRLRNHTNKHISYLACGEYGPKTIRPHYHCAIYNYKPTDLKTYKMNHTEDMLYTSKTVERIWGKGYVIIGELSYESTAYIARYVVKKAFGITNELHIKNKREPEFILTSRRPALADEIRKHPIWERIKKNGNVLVKTKNGVIARPIPQYLRKKWKDFENREEYFKQLQENHKANVKQMNEQADQNSKTFWWLLKQKRATLLKKITHLPRKDLTNLTE